MMRLGILGEPMDWLSEGPDRPTGGSYLIHRWSPDRLPEAVRHEVQEYTDEPMSGNPEISEVLGPADSRRVRTLVPGQQAIRRTGKGDREVVLAVHRIR